MLDERLFADLDDLQSSRRPHRRDSARFPEAILEHACCASIPSTAVMASIVIADATADYDGRHLETRPLGGTESSVIRCARELARRGHAVTVHTRCTKSVEDHGVSWRPLDSRPQDRCDLSIAVQQPRLLGYVSRPKRRAIWVLWPANQLRHYKQFWRMWLYRPVTVLASLYQVQNYSRLLPPRQPDVVIPLAVADDIRGLGARTTVPGRRAIFASNPQRNLLRLVEIWATLILPRAPDAVLDIFGIHALHAGEDAWKLWGGSVLPTGLPQHARNSIRVHPTVGREELIEAMRDSRVMLYLGHKCEAFCLSLAEAQALGVPAVIAPVAALPERVIDGVTGFHHADPERFAEAAVSLLVDDTLWRRQHEAALHHQQGIAWSDYAERLEKALLGTAPVDSLPRARTV
ncbi:MAG: glycosyltransferase [Xanthobacteraceae bacterium]